MPTSVVLGGLSPACLPGLLLDDVGILGAAFLSHRAQVPIVVLTAKDLTEDERRVVNERTLLVLTKGAQPLSSLGAALDAIAQRPREMAE